MHPFAKNNVTDTGNCLNIPEQINSENFIWDDKNPDYIIASEHTYFRKDYWQKFCELVKNNPNAILIFSAGEAITPDLNIFDYALVHDRKLKDLDRVVHVVYFHEDFINRGNTHTVSKADALNLLHNGKLRFCNFLYGNGRAIPMRDKMFHAISNYKHVEALLFVHLQSFQ